MTTTTLHAPASLQAVPAGARFAYNGILTSKRVCQEFLREFGIRRDWKNTSLAEMQSLLKACSHERMFSAAQRLCERSGDEFIPQLYMVSPGQDDTGPDEDRAAATLPPPPTMPPTSPPKATRTKARVAPPPPALTEAAQPAPPDMRPDMTQDTPKLAWTAQQQRAIDEIREAVLKQLGDAAPAPGGAPLTSLTPAALQDLAEAVMRRLAGSIDAKITQDMRQALQAAVAEAVKKLAPPPREFVVKTGHKAVKLPGVQHKDFDKLLATCSARLSDGHRLNCWLYGPPGTGKTSAARLAAQALGLKFATTGSLLTKYDITGFISAQGQLVRSPFRDIWEHGGVFLLDEIDGSDPRAIVAFNAALANAVMAFPDGMVERHKDCVMIAAANTSGMGATAEFNGRVKLDGASLDRFVMLDWPIDEGIEQALATHPRWLDTVRRVRANVKLRGIKNICISPRATFYGCALLEAGLPHDTVMTMVLRKGMSDEQWQQVK